MGEAVRDLLMPGQKVVHKLVAETAKGIALEVWDTCASVDKFYKAWPKKRIFVARNWRHFIGDARKSLATMLSVKPGTEKDPDGPKYHYSQHMRDEIFEALLIEGKMKSAPKMDLNQLRAAAGFEPISARQRFDA